MKILNTISNLLKKTGNAENTEKTGSEKFDTISIDKSTAPEVKKVLIKARKSSTHPGKRLYRHLEPQAFTEKPRTQYYTYTEQSPHTECMDCGSKFTSGDKVILSNRMHNLDILAPFPYCTKCSKQHIAIQKL